MYKQLKSSLLNLETVLNYFGITQEQYFNLDVIPFPIVNAEGAPVYLNNENKLIAYSSSPLSLNSASAYSVDKEEQLYVDFATYNPLKVCLTTLRELRFRFGRRELDNSFTNLTSKSILETQSKSSSADLRYNRDTGQLLSLNRFKLINDRYKFSNFDLINDISPVRDDIYDEVSPKKFIYNPVLNKIVLNQLTKSEQPVVNTEVTSQPQGKLMSNLNINAVVDKNKEALITATKLEVGNIAINLISEQLIKLMPPPLQFIINDNPLLKILIANAANLIIAQTSVNDPRLLAINEAMLTASYVQTLETFDFKSIVDGILRDIPADKLNALVNSNN